MVYPNYARTYELKDVRLPAGQLEDLKTLFCRIGDDERAYVVLKSAPAASSRFRAFLRAALTTPQ